MFQYQPYLQLHNGEINKQSIKVTEKKTDDVTLIFVEAEASEPLKGDSGACIAITPKKEIARFMADAKKGPWWCAPYFGTALQEIPVETQLLVLEKADGEFCVIVPVVNAEYRCTLQGGAPSFIAELSSWYEGLCTCNGLAFAYAEGSNPAELAKKCVRAALKELNSGVRSIEERRYPETMEYLGWCSWDSMQIRVNEEGLLQKCEEFKKKGIPVKWAILDDMWAHIRNFHGKTYNSFYDMVMMMQASPLYHFEADPYRFPNGLKGCIEKMKQYDMKVGMWHPTTGYWKGIDPEGPAYELLKDYLIRTEDGQYVPDWQKGNSYLYYKTLHDFFRECGANFVKIDKQSMIRMHYKGLAPVGRLAREYHDGMEASVGEHFDNCLINCMCLGSEDIWSRTVSPISRCSGDFQPENAEWFTKHVMQCSYNSLLAGQFYWCDWDMWWTDDSQGPKNSLMRAVSGGPIYVSDKIDRSRRDIFDPLALQDGRILRCDRPAMPAIDCITHDPSEEPIAFKVQNMAGEHGIMAVLNIHNDNLPVTTRISGSQVDGFAAEEYVVYDYFDRSMVILKADEDFKLELKNHDEYKLYIFAPLRNGFAAIGRTDKFIAPKTIQYVHKEEIVLCEDGPYAYVKDGELHFAG